VQGKLMGCLETQWVMTAYVITVTVLKDIIHPGRRSL